MCTVGLGVFFIVFFFCCFFFYYMFFLFVFFLFFFFFSSRRRHTRWPRDWSSDVCSSDLTASSSSTRRIVALALAAGATPGADLSSFAGSIPSTRGKRRRNVAPRPGSLSRSEEHTSELQSRGHLVCRLLLEKKKKNQLYCH